MKRFLYIAVFTVVSILTLEAANPHDLRIYINPGHGGWTADDRPCQLVTHPAAFNRTQTDTLSFFESNTDLEKGFGLMERLIDFGIPFDRNANQTGAGNRVGAARDLEQNIVMSRVKNGPYFDDNKTASQYGGNVPEEYYWYNRNLTDICAEAQVNDFDMFISIHSNAGAGLYSNYPLYLYRGYDDCREASGNTKSLQTLSRKMAETCWDYGYENPHQYWSHFKTSKYVKGDLDFYGDNGIWATRSDGSRVYGYLGALRHNVPGFLVEGYFHSYEPARHRAMNWDVCRMEGIAYAHGIADYFGIQKETFGSIYGIVRAAEEKFTHAYYHPASDSDDIYLPLNEATVILLKEGIEKACYITDGNYNGAFVFDRLEPGTYSMEISCKGYSTAILSDIEVKASSIAYPKVFLNKTPPFRRAALAYGLANPEGASVIEYSLSADAERAEILIAPASDETPQLEDSIDLQVFETDARAGQHTFHLPETVRGSYRWGIRVTSFANTEAGEVYSDPSGLTGCRGGVVNITDSGQETFGYTLVAHGSNNGIDIYDPAGIKVGSRRWKGNPLWGNSTTTTRSDPYRGNERNGKAVFASWGDYACGMVTVDPLGQSEPQALYAGNMQSGGHFIFNGVNVGGGTPGFCFYGEGEDTRLYAFSEDHEGKNGLGPTENSIVRYDIGMAPQIDFAPEVIGHKEILANTNVDLITCRNGIFAAQNRAAGQNTETYPGFIYVEAEGHSVTFNSGRDLPSLNACTTGIAATADGSILSVSDTSAINIYNMEWEDDTPSIQLAYKIPTGVTQEFIHMRFDAAGNLHTYQTSAGGYHVYALRSEGIPLLYEAPSVIVTGVENTEHDRALDKTIYYNPEGLQISRERLSPGIYIKVTGSKTEKIIVR